MPEPNILKDRADANAKVALSPTLNNQITNNGNGNGSNNNNNANDNNNNNNSSDSSSMNIYRQKRNTKLTKRRSQSLAASAAKAEYAIQDAALVLTTHWGSSPLGKAPGLLAAELNYSWLPRFLAADAICHRAGVSHAFSSRVSGLPPTGAESRGMLLEQLEATHQWIVNAVQMLGRSSIASSLRERLKNVKEVDTRSTACILTIWTLNKYLRSTEREAAGVPAQWSDSTNHITLWQLVRLLLKTSEVLSKSWRLHKLRTEHYGNGEDDDDDDDGDDDGNSSSNSNTIQSNKSAATKTINPSPLLNQNSNSIGTNKAHANSKSTDTDKGIGTGTSNEGYNTRASVRFFSDNAGSDGSDNGITYGENSSSNNFCDYVSDVVDSYTEADMLLQPEFVASVCRCVVFKCLDDY